MKYKRNYIIGIILIMGLALALALTGCRSTSAEDPDVRRDEEPAEASGESEEAQDETSNEEASTETEDSSANDEEFIRKDVEAVIASANITKEDLAEAMKSDTESAEVYALANLNIDECAELLAAHLGTEIQSVDVNGNKADVKVIMTMPDYDSMNKLLDDMIKEYSADENNASKSTDETYKDIGEMILELYSREDLPEKTEEIDISYTKVVDKWSMDDSSQVMSKLENAFLGG